MKRVCLADYFLLDDDFVVDQKNQSKFIDWDDIQSISKLSEKYKIPFNNLNENFEFKPIVFTKLPKEFLRFAKEPFNFPVEKLYDYMIFNILNYSKLIKTHNDFDDENDNLLDDSYEVQSFSKNDFVNSFFLLCSGKVYPSVYLQIGQYASSVIVNCENRITILKLFYVDKFGCIYVGFKRYQPLFLNEQRYERIMDQILSGDFSNILYSLSD